MFKALFSIISIVFAMSVYADDSFLNECKKLPVPSIEVSYEEVQAGFDNSKSILDLTNIKDKGVANLAGAVVTGLVTSDGTYKQELNMNAIKDNATGRICGTPIVKIKLFYANVVLNVAKEYKEGTCAFNEIKAHEEHHVAILSEFVKESQAIVLQKLTDEFTNNIQIVAPGESVGRLMADKVRKISMEQLALVTNHQLEFDSKDEYARVAKLCNGDINKIAKKVSPN